MIPPTGVVREIKAIYTHVIITSILKENSEKIEISRLVLSHVNIILKSVNWIHHFLLKWN